MKKIFLILTLLMSAPSFASDCKMSIDFSTGYIEDATHPIIANSSMSFAEGQAKIEEAIAEKGYTIDATSKNVIKIMFGCVLTDGNPKIKMSIAAMSFKSEVENLESNSQGVGFSGLSADQHAFNKSLRRLVRQMEVCK